MIYMSWDDLASMPQLTAAKTFLIGLELFNLFNLQTVTIWFIGHTELKEAHD